MVTIDPHTPALMLTQNQFQGKAIIQIPHSSTTLLLTAMASCVHRMKMAASSHVLCAQSDLHTLNFNSYSVNNVNCVRIYISPWLLPHIVCMIIPYLMLINAKIMLVNNYSER